MKISELTNEEIVFIYYRHQRFLEIHDKLIKDLKSGNDATPFVHLDILDIDSLINNPHIALLRQINSKLEPIVDLIVDSFPEIESKTLLLVDNPLNINDDEQEEDL